MNARRLLLFAWFACFAWLAACTKPTASASHAPHAADGGSSPASAVLDELHVAGSCTCCGDPNEDVDLADPGRRYAPRPVLPPEVYTATVRANPSALGGARIRSRLIFAAADRRNVLGTLPSTVAVRAAGPMKNSTGSEGLGYSIRLVDPDGRRCQGFVSASVVTAP